MNEERNTQVDDGSGKLCALPMQVLPTGDGVLLKRGVTEILLRGSQYLEVMRLVLETLSPKEGGSEEDVLNRFAAPDRPAVQKLLGDLVAQRFLVPVDSPLIMGDQGDYQETATDLFYWHFGQPASEIESRMADTRLAVIGRNFVAKQVVIALIELGAKRLEWIDAPLLTNTSFSESGVGPSDGSEASPVIIRDYDDWSNSPDATDLDCLIATSDFGGSYYMRDWNKFCIAQGVNFLPVVLQDLSGYVGPFVIPGQTACFECLRIRENSNLEERERARVPERAAANGQHTVGFLPSMARIVGDLAALEVSKFTGGWLRNKSIGTLIEIDFLEPGLSARKVLKQPWCGVCGSAAVSPPVAQTMGVVMPGNEVR